MPPAGDHRPEQQLAQADHDPGGPAAVQREQPAVPADAVAPRPPPGALRQQPAAADARAATRRPAWCVHGPRSARRARDGARVSHFQFGPRCIRLLARPLVVTLASFSVCGRGLPHENAAATNERLGESIALRRRSVPCSAGGLAPQEQVEQSEQGGPPAAPNRVRRSSVATLVTLYVQWYRLPCQPHARMRMRVPL